MTAPATTAVPTFADLVSGGVAGTVGRLGAAPPWRPPTRVVSRFHAGHGWVEAAGAGTVTDDAGEYLFGSQSLKITTSATAAQLTSARKTGLTAFNLSTGMLRLWIRVTNAAAIQQLLVYASSTGFAGSVFAAFDIKPTGNYPQLRNGEWGCLTFGPDQFTTLGGGGAPDWPAINSLQISVSSNSTTPTVVHVGAVDVVPRPADAFCSFTFDDGYAEVYTKARPVMDAYGFAGTVFIIADIIGTAGFMTMDQLKKLETAGWEVAAHSENLADHNQAAGLLTSGTYALRRNLLSQRHWLWGNGFRGTGIAYPRGANSAAMREEVRKVYSYGRSVQAPAGSESVPPADVMQLRAHEIYQATTPTAIDTIVDTAVTGKRWAILEFHGIKDSPDGANIYDYSTANFSTVAANVATSGAVVLPVADVLAGY